MNNENLKFNREKALYNKSRGNLIGNLLNICDLKISLYNRVYNNNSKNGFINLPIRFNHYKVNKNIYKGVKQ